MNVGSKHQKEFKALSPNTENNPLGGSSFIDLPKEHRVLYTTVWAITEATTSNWKIQLLEMLANAQRDGRPAEYRWHPLFNAAKFADAHY